ncbi:MAG: hypothetical protein A2283_05195 [Lentisphaerae bacterium RIFOXYA12_FULL_48_11]|nr:MAG: hypothetical protein A2283_05195 [Lentisphaerae bacterium RIFOXYA12_FULL_48_11]
MRDEEVQTPPSVMSESNRRHQYVLGLLATRTWIIYRRNGQGFKYKSAVYIRTYARVQDIRQIYPVIKYRYTLIYPTYPWHTLNYSDKPACVI